MELNFIGWNRKVLHHTHDVLPVFEVDDSFEVLDELYYVPSYAPLRMRGRVNNLALSGNFLVEVVLQEEELFSCLVRFAQANPAKTLHRLAPIVSDAMKDIAGSGESNDSDGKV